MARKMGVELVPGSTCGDRGAGLQDAFSGSFPNAVYVPCFHPFPAGRPVTHPLCGCCSCRKTSDYTHVVSNANARKHLIGGADYFSDVIKPAIRDVHLCRSVSAAAALGRLRVLGGGIE